MSYNFFIYRLELSCCGNMSMKIVLIIRLKDIIIRKEIEIYGIYLYPIIFYFNRELIRVAYNLQQIIYSFTLYIDYKLTVSDT